MRGRRRESRERRDGGASDGDGYRSDCHRRARIWHTLETMPTEMARQLIVEPFRRRQCVELLSGEDFFRRMGRRHSRKQVTTPERIAWIVMASGHDIQRRYVSRIKCVAVVSSEDLLDGRVEKPRFVARPDVIAEVLCDICRDFIIRSAREVVEKGLPVLVRRGTQL